MNNERNDSDIIAVVISDNQVKEIPDDVIDNVAQIGIASLVGFMIALIIVLWRHFTED